MKITADAKTLGAAIAWGTKGASRAQGASTEATAIIGNVSGTTLTLFSVDSTAYFSAKVDVARDLDDNDEVTFKVFAPQFATMANLLKSGEATLDIEPKKVTVTSGRSKFDFAQVVSRQVPPPTLPASVGAMAISELRAAANHAASAASSDATVPLLTSVLVEFNPEDAEVVFEATDRYRMVVRKMTYAPASDIDKSSVLVPAAELKRLLSDMPSEDDVDMHAGDSYFGISSAKFSGYVSLMEGTPVPYQRMLEQPFPNRVVVNRNELRTAVSNVVSMSAASDRIILLINADEITVTNPSRSTESAVDYGVDPVLEEDSFEIGYHAQYLTGALTLAKSEDVSLSFSHPSAKPTIFHELDAGGHDDPTYNHIVMPLR